MTADQIQVVGLGLTFCPDQEVNAFEVKDVNLFARKIMFKIIFDKDIRGPLSGVTSDKLWKNKTINKVKVLMELWEESNPSDELLEKPPLNSSSSPQIDGFFPPPHLYKAKSRFFPVLQGNPNVWAFTQQVTRG